MKKIKENEDFSHDGVAMRNTNTSEYLNARDRRMRIREEYAEKKKLEKRMDTIESTMMQILQLLEERK